MGNYAQKVEVLAPVKYFVKLTAVDFDMSGAWSEVLRQDAMDEQRKDEDDARAAATVERLAREAAELAAGQGDDVEFWKWMRAVAPLAPPACSADEGLDWERCLALNGEPFEPGKLVDGGCWREGYSMDDDSASRSASRDSFGALGEGFEPPHHDLWLSVRNEMARWEKDPACIELRGRVRVGGSSTNWCSYGTCHVVTPGAPDWFYRVSVDSGSSYGRATVAAVVRLKALELMGIHGPWRKARHGWLPEEEILMWRQADRDYQQVSKAKQVAQCQAGVEWPESPCCANYFAVLPEERAARVCLLHAGGTHNSPWVERMERVLGPKSTWAEQLRPAFW